MDTEAAHWLINFGAAGVFLVLICFKVFVPGWYARKLETALELREQENEVLRKSNKDLADIAANSNQIIGALKSIAIERQGRDEIKTISSPGEDA